MDIKDCHVVIKANIYTDNSKPSKLSVIVTNDGVLQSYLEYLLKNRSKSRSWSRASTQAVGLLVDYVAANRNIFEHPHEMFEEFTNSLFVGTIDLNGNDESGLYWEPHSIPTANKKIKYITMFTDWLADKNDNEHFRLNPYRKATTYESIINWAAYCHRQDKSFLSHLSPEVNAKENSYLSRHIRNHKEQAFTDEFLSFPEEYFYKFIYDGFARQSYENCKEVEYRLKLRDVLITLLLHFGGLRKSEPFHLWIDDVMADPIKYVDEMGIEHVSALVKVYHPAEGLSPERLSKKRERRIVVLQRDFNMKPRNKEEEIPKRYAGWKSNVLDSRSEKCFYVNWFHSKAGVLFWQLWNKYLEFEYKTPPDNDPHPFAFTTKDGNPYTIASYEKQHELAAKKIGLEHKKNLGTSEHGHRHAYGYRMFESKELSSIQMQKLMHHASPESTQIYTQPKNEDVRRELQALSKKLEINEPEADDLFDIV